MCYIFKKNLFLKGWGAHPVKCMLGKQRSKLSAQNPCKKIRQSGDACNPTTGGDSASDRPCLRNPGRWMAPEEWEPGLTSDLHTHLPAYTHTPEHIYTQNFL